MKKCARIGHNDIYILDEYVENNDKQIDIDELITEVKAKTIMNQDEEKEHIKTKAISWDGNVLTNITYVKEKCDKVRKKYSEYSNLKSSQNKET